MYILRLKCVNIQKMDATCPVLLDYSAPDGGLALSEITAEDI